MKAPAILTCAAWLTATAAMAQAPPPANAPPSQAKAPPTPVSPLTVPAPPNRALLEKQAREFVNAYAAPTVKLGQFARWYPRQQDLRPTPGRWDIPAASDIRLVDVITPACVAVTGLIPEQANLIRAQVEKVAKAIGAPMAPSNCTPNIQILFTSEPQRDLDAIAARSPAALGYEGVKTVTRPIQAWYVTASLGQPAPPDRGLKSAGAEVDPLQSYLAFDSRTERFKDKLGATPAEHGPLLAEGRPCIDTSFLICPHAAFLNILVIVDAGHMGDVSLDLSADYVAMLALSQPHSLDGCMALPSVIDLYAKDCPGREPPTGLTPADMAYLSSLYAADLTVEKAREQSDIAKRMATLLTAAKAPAR